MAIELREVTSENFFPCILLKSEDRKGYHLFEEHVTSNAFSLAQAKVEPHWIPKAVYHDGEIVGFTMYGWLDSHQFHFITRLMIDCRHQGNGYGRAAMLAVIKELKERDATEVYTSIVETNDGARKLYESLGFKPTGEYIEFGNEREPLFSLKIC